MGSLFQDFDKVSISIERLKTFEPEEGYYLAFSGGKDSEVLYHLAKKAKVKFDAHFNLTTVDPPELIKFIKKEYPDVNINIPVTSMRKLIIKKRRPPLRTARFCCEELKERGGSGRFVLTGIRAEESRSRYMRRMYEPCNIHNGKKILHPIIDWNQQEIWDFLTQNNIPYCDLYDRGFSRIGCIGCPCQSVKDMKRDFEMWPTFKVMYINSFRDMLKKMEIDGIPRPWQNEVEVFQWWLKERRVHSNAQRYLFEN